MCLKVYIYSAYIAAVSEKETPKPARPSGMYIDKSGELTEHINFSNGGGGGGVLPNFFEKCLRYLFISTVHRQNFRNLKRFFKDLIAIILAVVLPEVSSMKYSFLNTSSPQNFSLPEGRKYM